MKTNPNDPINAFRPEPNNQDYHGLTKREEFAKAAMKILVSTCGGSISAKMIAREAVKCADALIDALNEEKK